jgi:hypothetical protein
MDDAGNYDDANSIPEGQAGPAPLKPYNYAGNGEAPAAAGYNYLHAKGFADSVTQDGYKTMTAPDVAEKNRQIVNAEANTPAVREPTVANSRVNARAAERAAIMSKMRKGQ